MESIDLEHFHHQKGLLGSLGLEHKKKIRRETLPYCSRGKAEPSCRWWCRLRKFLPNGLYFTPEIRAKVGLVAEGEYSWG